MAAVQDDRICGKVGMEVVTHSPLLVCADPARQYPCMDDTSARHGWIGLCPMLCLLCTACPACDVVLLHALLWVHGARMYAYCLAAFC